MLRVPDIDDVTYEQIVERAVNKIPTMTDKWTDFNFSDPGITVLQTYAWLVDMLNYYMNATGDVHVGKYLKLLGIKPIKKCAADAILCVDSDKDFVELRKGREFLAGKTPFYLKEDACFVPNRFISYLNEIDGEAIDLTMFAGADGDYANIFATDFKECAAGWFGFEKKPQKQFTMFVTVEENKNRNTFSKDFSLGELTWQYYTADGFVDMKVMKDQTCGLLKSGEIVFEIPDDNMESYTHAANGIKAYYIRCVLKHNFYDMLPRIGKVYLNPIRVEQTKQICRCETLVYKGDLEMTIPGYVPVDAFLMVGLQQMDGSYRVIYNYSYLDNPGCEILDGEKEGNKIIRLSKPWNRMVKGTKIQIMILSMEGLPYFTLGTADGCNHQKVEFDYPGIHHLSVAFWEKRRDGNLYYTPYKEVDDLDTYGYSDHVFCYDKEDKTLVFGDSIHGVLPKKGQTLCLSELSVSEFENGNVMAGGIREITAQDDEQLNVYNPLPATGGRADETIPEMMERLRDMLLKQNRLVSEQDYIDTIKNTPGLMIDMVSVIPDKEYAKFHNRPVTGDEVVVVKPYSREKTPILSESYKKIITDYIEPLRLINTKIQIVSPSYVGIEVHAKIHVNNRSEADKQAILSVLEEELSYEKQKHAFGHSIILGRVFTKLDALEGVKYIESLSLERVGQGAEKNNRGDIHLHKDALSYIRELDIDYVL
ncbi:MAG: baseplate J/gp47 family protein [Lachnospiraceae bacterium]|nr:baseplate J/gp47 family protein [Lachnospiraceae bacterium]